MKAKEYIERYGIEWYKAYLAKKRERYTNDSEFRDACKLKSREGQRERCHSDSEYQKARNARSKECNRKRYKNDAEFRLKNRLLLTMYRYCRAGEETKIENYKLAKADNFKGWDIHHRLELTLDGEYAHSREELKRLDMYYNRPYYELIFLHHNDHTKLHLKARQL